LAQSNETEAKHSALLVRAPVNLFNVFEHEAQRRL
jgi:hypothetical protein